MQNNNQDQHKTQGKALLADITLDGAKITQESRVQLFDENNAAVIVVPRAVTNMYSKKDGDQAATGAGK